MFVCLGGGGQFCSEYQLNIDIKKNNRHDQKQIQNKVFSTEELLQQRTGGGHQHRLHNHDNREAIVRK